MFAFKNGGECLSSPDSHLDVTMIYKESDECNNYKGGLNSMNVYIIKGELAYFSSYGIRVVRS